MCILRQDVVCYALRVSRLQAAEMTTRQHLFHESPDSFFPSSGRLRDSLVRKLGAWKSAFLPCGSPTLDDCAVNILGIIRDAIFARIFNIKGGKESILSSVGFWVACSDLSEAYDFCLQLCRSAFWFHRSRSSGFENQRIYQVDFSASGCIKTGLNLCYSSSTFVSCCCRVCHDICETLRQDTTVEEYCSFPEVLYRLISGSTRNVLTFLDHNRSAINLEHQLLSISVDGYLSKCRLQGKLEGLCGTDDESIETALDDCGCFVLLKGIDSLFATSSSNQSGTNYWALVVDLLREYSVVWTTNDLPVHLFCLYELDPTESSVSVLNFDTDTTAPSVDIPNYILENVSYFRYRIDLSRATGGESAMREHYLRRHVPSDGGESSETLLRYLVSLTSGYGLRRLGVITRMASCEYMASLKGDMRGFEQSKEQKFRNIALTARCFEKAISLSPAVSTPVGMTGLCVIPYSHGDGSTVFSSFPPLSVTPGGTVEICRGFSSLILRESLLHDLTSFVSGTDQITDSTVDKTPFVFIEGPSGCGKTHLSAALAHELRSTLVLVNVLDFLRPQVGVSEKLVHEFFSSILRQYSSESSGQGTCSFLWLYNALGNGRSSVRCVVVLEGVGCLVEDSAYMQSLLYALSMEISRFRDFTSWSGIYSVLFVFTCEDVASIPQRLREACMSSRQFSMKNNISSADKAAACFELYLNGRGYLLERFREVWPLWREDSAVSSLRACDIVLLCRMATLWSLNRAATSISSSVPLGGLIEALCAVPP
ncbi:hypothetical protein X943_002773 [Babesia divergens]|uniref:ATPase AAA-type core domain-containing protein n=1 Tax=Babesia divergens TaxID=32595 RepID=A0AAD9G7K2_BABDI|nr:hypothetical protein X943_002773 [Babesia divergens]